MIVKEIGSYHPVVIHYLTSLQMVVYVDGHYRYTKGGSPLRFRVDGSTPISNLVFEHSHELIDSWKNKNFGLRTPQEKLPE